MTNKYFVKRECWRRWPKVLIMCKKVDKDAYERKRYVPEKTCTIEPRDGFGICRRCGAELTMYEGYDPWENEYRGGYCLQCGAEVVSE